MSQDLILKLSKPHALSLDEIRTQLQTSDQGLDPQMAAQRLSEFGPNSLPSAPPPSVFKIFAHQFKSPLIYVLGIAAGISILLGDTTDALFIVIVLLVNAIVGTLQEYGAEKSAQALRQLSALHATVERSGEVFEVDAEALVPGDVVLLESGDKVPADLRFLSTHSFEVDESLLTGESLPVAKDHRPQLDSEISLGDRLNMAFAGSVVTRGRSKAVVVGTGLNTELGKIANDISAKKITKAPLLIRMEIFTQKLGIFLLVVAVAMGGYLLYTGEGWVNVLMFIVAVSVAAIPEGLPVALTVALSIATRRMLKRNVIVRKLPAVESLGSCTFIATDKTGTLTMNQLTVQAVAIPNEPSFDVTGGGLEVAGVIQTSSGKSMGDEQARVVQELVTAGVLCNDASLAQKDDSWVGHGDAVDLSLLVLAHKSGSHHSKIRDRFELIDEIPFDSTNQYAATLHKGAAGKSIISVKGAIERVLPMCDLMLTSKGHEKVNSAAITSVADSMADSGFRVLAIAGKRMGENPAKLTKEIGSLTFLGVVGMIDPLRPEAFDAIKSCKSAGIDVAMVTGDHPKTALSIAKSLGLASSDREIVTGPQFAAASMADKQQLVKQAKVFARVEPQQKLEIVQSLIEQGQFVAVTGDGANDAPALKAAHVGVAMGKSGTDVAKETSDLIITDDRFASIVGGIEEGRIAYSNIRKVIYLLISTGIAEIIVFALAILFGTPLPLIPVQILWLNLVTNGIQDVALAFEPGEGDELARPPRRPNEPIFDKLMLERVILSSIVMGGVSFWQFYYLLESGMELEKARNLVLLLMVLFENVMVGNCRSETKSAFSLNPMRNPLLLFGTLFAQFIHIAAMYTPGLKDVLELAPVTFNEWVRLFLVSLSVLLAMEVYKFVRGQKFRM